MDETRLTIDTLTNPKSRPDLKPFLQATLRDKQGSLRGIICITGYPHEDIFTVTLDSGESPVQRSIKLVVKL
jgi:hypothetical protein